MSIATEKRLDHLHWPLVLCTIVICSLGVWNLASATKSAMNPMWFAQFRWMALGAVGISSTWAQMTAASRSFTNGTRPVRHS